MTDPHFNRILQQANANKQTHETQEAALQLQFDIPWPEVEHYGAVHARETAELATQIYRRLPSHMIKTDNPHLAKREDEVIKYAAMYHDIGRTQPWRKEDPHHARRSAEIAEGLLKNEPNLDADPALREYLLAEVPRIITAHDLSAPELPTDPRAVALWDADSLEACRFAPGTRVCLELMKKRYERLCSPWAKDRDLQSGWRKMRGW